MKVLVGDFRYELPPISWRTGYCPLVLRYILYRYIQCPSRAYPDSTNLSWTSCHAM